MVGMTLAAMQPAYAATIGGDVLYGAGAGAASLGVFYGAQGYFNQTEGRALAASTLTAILLSAWIQVGGNGGDTGDFLATLAAAGLTFGLGKYIYEQNSQAISAVVTGAEAQVAAAAQAGTGS
jgi:hypothetical protein